jgi:tetratricopeptide (TPR) repeat protein
VAYGSQLGGQRAKSHAAAARALIELNPERHEELAALIAQHFEQGRETLEAARWYARAAHRAGYGHPQDAMRFWTKVSELADQLPEDDETAALGVFSRLLRLDYAWRIGMEKNAVDDLMAEAEERATKMGDLRSLTLLRMLGRARPGLEQTGSEWIAAVGEAVDLADRSGDRDLRVAIRTASSYAYLASGDLDGCERLLDEALELSDDDQDAGAAIVIGNPYAFALHFKGVIERERGRFDRADELFNAALRIAAEHGDPETESWTRGQKAILASLRGDPDALAQAERNLELTDRLGDVFSRTWALVYVCFVRLDLGDAAGALEAIERAESTYREAMGGGGEAEAWRAALNGQALTRLGRVEEGLERAEYAARIAREREMRWSAPRTLRALAEARAASGDLKGAAKALDESAAVARQTGSVVELEETEKARETVSAAPT